MDKDDKDKFNKGKSDDFIIRRKESSSSSPKGFDEPLLRKNTDNKPKSTLVTPSSPKRTMVTPNEPNRPQQRQMYSPDTQKPQTPNNENKRPQMFEDFGMRRRAEEKPKPDLDILGRPRVSRPEQPAQQPKVEKPTPNLQVDKDVRLGNIPKPIRPENKPIVQDPNARKVDAIKINPVTPQQPKQKVQFIKPEVHKEKPEEVELIGVKKQEQPAQKPKPQPKPAEPEVVKTTTSTLQKPKRELPEDKSKEIGAKAGSKKYKADTRLNRSAKSLKKYNKEFEKWRKSQEEPLVEEYGDVKVQDGRNSERVITTSLVLVVIMILSLFLLFYCNVINPEDNTDDGRVRVSVDIDDDAFVDVDAYGNVVEKEIYPGDYMDFNIIATNAYNIKGDNSTEYTWDSVFVRYKIYLRVEGVDYDMILVNIANQGEKKVPAIIPTIDINNFQTYNKDSEDQFTDPITGVPIVRESDGYYYYNGILSYNQSIVLCTGILFNGDAIIPDFATKSAELVVEVQAATADYTSIRERTIWEKAPQTWINYMQKHYFSNIS